MRRAISASRIWIACVRGERPAEQHARLRVVEQLREAGLRGADHAPGDAVACLRQAGQRRLEAASCCRAACSPPARRRRRRRARRSPRRAAKTCARSPAPRSRACPSRRGSRGCLPRSSPRRRATSAIGAFVIHIFAPFITQSLPRRFAWVFMLTGSEPPCGSVSPKQPISSPRRHARQVLLRCSSLPKAWIGYMQRLDCTETKLRSPNRRARAPGRSGRSRPAFMPAQP